MRSYTDILTIANKSKAYARSQILKSSTALENNDSPKEYFDAIDSAVTKDIRSLIHQQTNLQSNRLEKNKDVIYYENVIHVTSKYSIGNCYELALQALDYVLNTTNIDAEVYSIMGGNHCFLVLNRDKDSNPSNPETWGSNAVICDPLANKAYQAKEYHTKLNTLYRSADKNCMDDFEVRPRSW